VLLKFFYVVIASGWKELPACAIHLSWEEIPQNDNVAKTQN